MIYDGELFDTVYHSDTAAYEESLNRLKALPVETIHGGHFDSFGKEKMISIIEAYLAGGARMIEPALWVEGQLEGKEG